MTVESLGWIHISIVPECVQITILRALTFVLFFAHFGRAQGRGPNLVKPNRVFAYAVFLWREANRQSYILYTEQRLEQNLLWFLNFVGDFSDSANKGHFPNKARGVQNFLLELQIGFQRASIRGEFHTKTRRVFLADFCKDFQK